MPTVAVLFRRWRARLRGRSCRCPGTDKTASYSGLTTEGGKDEPRTIAHDHSSRPHRSRLACRIRVGALGLELGHAGERRVDTGHERRLQHGQPGRLPVRIAGWAQLLYGFLPPRPPAPGGAPVTAGAPVNSSANDCCPTPVQDGRLFFVSTRAGGCGGGDIYVASPEGSGWSAPKHLGCQLNSAGDEFRPSVPQERPRGTPVYLFCTPPR